MLESFPFPGDIPDPGIEPRSPAWQANSLLLKPPGKHNHRKRLKTELQKVICINYCRQKFAWMVQMEFAGKGAGKRCCCNHSNIC